MITDKNKSVGEMERANTSRKGHLSGFIDYTIIELSQREYRTFPIVSRLHQIYQDQRYWLSDRHVVATTCGFNNAFSYSTCEPNESLSCILKRLTDACTYKNIETISHSFQCRLPCISTPISQSDMIVVTSSTEWNQLQNACS